MSDFKLTPQLITKVLKTVDAGLVAGLGNQKPGEMCVEAAVCYAMGLPHGDKPTCVDDSIRAVKIGLNDSNWSSQKTRALGLRRLSVLQLGTKGNFDSVQFAEKLVIQTVRVILPIALSAANIHPNIITACQKVETLQEAAAAAADAAARAAADAAADYAADAADYAARAARAAAAAADYAAAAADYAARAAAADYAARAAAAADADYAAARAADAADYAADAAARAAARAARAAAADYAARAAARAADADAAARAADADADKTLTTATKMVEDILIEMNVPAVKYLDLL